MLIKETSREDKQGGGQRRNQQNTRKTARGIRQTAPKKDPSVIPRKSYFFEHDYRQEEEDVGDESKEAEAKDKKLTEGEEVKSSEATVGDQSEGGGGEGGLGEEGEGEKTIDNSNKENRKGVAVDREESGEEGDEAKSSHRSFGKPKQGQRFGNRRGRGGARGGGGGFHKRSGRDQWLENSEDLEIDRWAHDRFDPNEQVPKTTGK